MSDARDIATEIEAKKHAYRQTQDGIVISFVAHPNDVTADIATAPLGTRYRLFLVEVGDDEQPVPKTHQRAPEKPKTPFHDKPYSVQAGIRCADPRFQEFLRASYAAEWLACDVVGAAIEDVAADVVRHYCGIGSRKDLDRVDPAYVRDQWRHMNAEFEQRAGLVPEAR